MEKEKIIIAIDGYSSTGKSSFAKRIASRLGIIHLDSGAMYRAVTIYALNKGLIAADGTIDKVALKEALGTLKVEQKCISVDGFAKAITYMNGELVEDRIRMMDVSNNVSPISACGFVRDFVDDILQRYATEGGVVLDGRDIGVKVFPNADLKIFMVADPQVRARRRYNEMLAAGKSVSFDEVMENILKRDSSDTSRAVSPLKKADDAIVLDNTYMNFEQQMEWFEALLFEKFGISL
jgi:cytidylate kinase